MEIVIPKRRAALYWGEITAVYHEYETPAVMNKMLAHWRYWS